VSDVQGALIHPGGTLKVHGSGFAPSTAYALAVDGVWKPLAGVATDENGHFAAEVQLPGTSVSGRHQVLVAYKGTVVSQQPITVGAPIADTFLKALLVGFSASNPDRATGLLVLTGLLSIGLLAWGTRVIGGGRIESPKGLRRRARDVVGTPFGSAEARLAEADSASD
jgi:hypothetical protein